MRALPILKLSGQSCRPNCSDCCGFVACTRDEAAAVERFARENQIVPRRQGSTCPYAQENRCTVYPVRPFICRLFGHTPKLACPHGCNGMMIPIRREEKIMREYMAFEKPNQFLHSAVYSSEEIMRLFVGSLESA